MLASVHITHVAILLGLILYASWKLMMMLNGTYKSWNYLIGQQKGAGGLTFYKQPCYAWLDMAAASQYKSE